MSYPLCQGIRMTQQVTCPKCSHKFALDQAINRELELHVRAEIAEEFQTKELQLRAEFANQVNEKASQATKALAVELRGSPGGMLTIEVVRLETDRSTVAAIPSRHVNAILQAAILQK